MASSWSNDQIDRAIAALQQGMIDWAESGAPYSTKVDGIEVTYSTAPQFQSAIYHLEQIKARNAGTKTSKIRFR